MYFSFACKALEVYGTAEYAGICDPRAVITAIDIAERILLFI
jgi:hypothetical protein